MLDKVRNNLIKHSFQLAGIISPESVPTAEELEDAAHTLNAMLQSWNNDGFRLFKIKTGYMPFISGENEYKLATQAYKNFGASKVSTFKTIGATKLKINNISGVSTGDNFVVINNTVSDPNNIKEVDYEKAVFVLENPLNMNVYKDDSVFYGDFSIAKTIKKDFSSSFNSIAYNDYTISPAVGDMLYISLANSWNKVVITKVEPASKTVTFTPSLSKNSVTSDYIVFGKRVNSSSLADDAVLSTRLLVTEGYDFVPDSIALPSADGMGDILTVERVNKDNSEIILEKEISASALKKMGKERIDAGTIYNSKVEMSWKEVSGLVPVETLDWGYVRESHVATQDWGFVKNPTDEVLNWGNLTGDAQLVGFAKKGNTSYALAQDTSTEKLFLFYKPFNGNWSVIETENYDLTDFSLYMTDSSAYVFDITNGLYELDGEYLNSIYSNSGIEAIVKFKDSWYLISPESGEVGSKRTVVSTKDFATFSDSWEIVLPSVENEAEFAGKLFIGKTDTFVTSDMKTFSKLEVYSDNRCVVGDRMINLNTNQICSYTLDGVKFLPMPMMLSYETTWAYKDDCSFIAIYGVMTKDGYIGTQIFTTNEFNPVWTPQVAVPGKVFDIFFSEGKAYFLSDIAVVSIEYYKGLKAKDVAAYGFGEKIGRPQEVMNVMKFSVNGNIELPMNPLSLKDFTLLPNKSSGEPVNYCFFRDAKDGKMMVWGTPNKFGEYLRFAYVEPITLLEDANSTPDFPDEYYEAVEDGLAAELAYHFQLPLERIQILQAKADASKQEALLHDNEDTSYDIVPNQRGL